MAELIPWADEEEKESKLLPYTVVYLTDAGDIAAALLGPLNQEESLLIPSTQLIWKDQHLTNEEFETEMEKRFAEDELFGSFLESGLDRHGIREKIPEEFRRKAGYLIANCPVFRGDLDNPEHLKALKERAMRGPVYIRNPDHYKLGRVRRWKKFFLDRPGTHSMRLVYDLKRANEKHLMAAPQKDAPTYIPNSMIFKHEIKEIAEQMRCTMQNALEETHLRIMVDVFSYRKPEAAQSVVALHKMGQRLFGETYWRTHALALGIRWRNGCYMDREHKAREVVERWKKRKMDRPKGKLASQLWDAIQDVSHARGKGNTRRKRR